MKRGDLKNLIIVVLFLELASIMSGTISIQACRKKSANPSPFYPFHLCIKLWDRKNHSFKLKSKSEHYQKRTCEEFNRNDGHFFETYSLIHSLKCGCSISALPPRNVSSISTSLNYHPPPFCFWTSATLALHWLHMKRSQHLKKKNKKE